MGIVYCILEIRILTTTMEDVQVTIENPCRSPKIPNAGRCPDSGDKWVGQNKSNNARAKANINNNDANSGVPFGPAKIVGIVGFALSMVGFLMFIIACIVWGWFWVSGFVLGLWAIAFGIAAFCLIYCKPQQTIAIVVLGALAIIFGFSLFMWALVWLCSGGYGGYDYWG